jgi:hypothetical protein
VNRQLHDHGFNGNRGAADLSILARAEMGSPAILHSTSHNLISAAKMFSFSK